MNSQHDHYVISRIAAHYKELQGQLDNITNREICDRLKVMKGQLDEFVSLREDFDYQSEVYDQYSDLTRQISIELSGRLKKYTWSVASDPGLKSQMKSMSLNEDVLFEHDDKCIICLDYLRRQKLVHTECGHIFHLDCFMSVLTHKPGHLTSMCPHCKIPLKAYTTGVPRLNKP